jgi:Flp pilus assembly protein TadG
MEASILNAGNTRIRRGQTLVEFAIVLPFIVLLLATIIDFGFFFYDFVAVHAASRAGSQAAMRANSGGTRLYSDAQIIQIMKSAHGPFNSLKTAEISITPLSHDPAFGGSHTSVTITIQHDHPFIFPVYVLGGQPSIAIKSRVKTFVVPGLSSNLTG